MTKPLLIYTTQQPPFSFSPISLVLPPSLSSLPCRRRTRQPHHHHRRPSLSPHLSFTQPCFPNVPASSPSRTDPPAPATTEPSPLYFPISPFPFSVSLFLSLVSFLFLFLYFILSLTFLSLTPPCQREYHLPLISPFHTLSNSFFVSVFFLFLVNGNYHQFSGQPIKWAPQPSHLNFSPISHSLSFNISHSSCWKWTAKAAPQPPMITIISPDPESFSSPICKPPLHPPICFVWFVGL